MKTLLLLSVFGVLLSPLSAFAATPVFEVTPDPIYLNETFTLACEELSVQSTQNNWVFIYAPGVDEEFTQAFGTCVGAEQDLNNVFLDPFIPGTYKVVIFNEDLRTGDDLSYLEMSTQAWFISESTFEMINDVRP